MFQGVVHIIEPGADDRRQLAAAMEPLQAEIRMHTAPDGFQAQLDATRPACLLTAAELPQVTGLELQAMLLANNPAIPVVMTSEGLDVSLVVEAMKQGAVEVLSKPIQPMAVLRALNEAVTLAATWFEIELSRKRLADAFTSLAGREKQILPYRAYGWTNKNIARELNLGVRTVEHYRSVIFEKMDADGPLELMRQWVLINVQSPRCVELCRHRIDGVRPRPTCASPSCTSVGVVATAPTLTGDHTAPFGA